MVLLLSELSQKTILRVEQFFYGNVQSGRKVKCNRAKHCFSRSLLPTEGGVKRGKGNRQTSKSETILLLLLLFQPASSVSPAYRVPKSVAITYVRTYIVRPHVGLTASLAQPDG